MATTTLYFASSVSGNVTNPNNALGAPDNVWAGNNASWTHRWRLEALPENTNADGTQTLTIKVRKNATGGGDPTITRVTLISGGTSTNLFSGTWTAPDSTAAQDLSYEFSGSLIQDADTADIEVVTSQNGGGPNQRGIQIDAATWDAAYIDSVVEERTLSLAATEDGNDVSSISGTVATSGTIAATEIGNDVVAINGTVESTLEERTLSLAATEVGNDVVYINAKEPTGIRVGTTSHSGGGIRTSSTVHYAWVEEANNLTLAATEVGNDTSEVNATVGNSLTLASTETGDDVTSINADVIVSASLNSTEVGNDVSAINADVIIGTTLDATESGDDTASITATVANSLALNATESGDDTVAIAADVAVSASLDSTETGDDITSISADVVVASSIDSTEVGDDSVAISGLVAFEGISGSLDAIEEGDDTTSVNLSNIIAASLNAEEVGNDSVLIDANVHIYADIAGQEEGDDVVSISVIFESVPVNVRWLNITTNSARLAWDKAA